MSMMNELLAIIWRNKNNGQTGTIKHWIPEEFGVGERFREAVKQTAKRNAAANPGYKHIFYGDSTWDEPDVYTRCVLDPKSTTVRCRDISKGYFSGPEAGERDYTFEL